MDREYTYSKSRLVFILEQILERDILDNPDYTTPDRAEEGFEKRAVIEFLLWFLDEAFPDNFTFACTFGELEADYPEEIARIIAAAEDWAPGGEPPAGDVIEVDFRTTRRRRPAPSGDEPEPPAST